MKWFGFVSVFGLLTSIALCDEYESLHEPVNIDGPTNQNEPVNIDGPTNQNEPVNIDGPTNQNEPVNIDGPTNQNEPVNINDPTNQNQTRECLRLKGPHDNQSCHEFEQRWVNKSDAKGLHSDITTMDLRGVSKKDVVVTVGCYAVYTFAQEMMGACVDAKLLLDLLLCQYDYLENKTSFLNQFHNVKSRDDIINWISDFKKCIGTTPYPPPVERSDTVHPPAVEDPDRMDKQWMRVDVVNIFFEPAKKMRAYIEKNNL